MRRNMIETVMGAVVLLVAVVFIVFAFRSAGLGNAGSDGYQVTVEFSVGSGLSAGTDVRLAGVKPVIQPAVEFDHMQVFLQRRDRGKKVLAVEAAGIQLVGRLVGGGGHHQSGIEHRLEQSPE